MEKEERRSGIHAITYDVAKEPDDYVKEEEKKRSVAEDVVVMRVDSEKQGIATEEKRSRIVAVEEKRNEVERQMMCSKRRRSYIQRRIRPLSRVLITAIIVTLLVLIRLLSRPRVIRLLLRHFLLHRT